VAIGGYASGLHAPGHQSPTEPYIVAHHLLLAHAKTVQVYKTEFNDIQNGIIGMASSGDYRYPLDPDSESDRMAAERAILFQLGWLTDPVFFGDYPKVMREQLGKRLPEFTKEEQELLRGSVDFVGLNYYSSFLATQPKETTSWEGYWSDIYVHFADDESWEQNQMGWNVAPDGLRQILLWIKERYNDPVIYITENGSAEKEQNLAMALVDERRRVFFEDHLRACAQAIQENVRLKGYFAWSLMDNFEWQFGYRRRFGLCYVDYKTLERTPKSSAIWYNETIVQNGRNIWDHDKQRQLAQKACVNRQLPEKVLIGYGSDLEAVRRAVHQGVNVVTWAFIDFVRVTDVADTLERRILQAEEVTDIRTNLDIAGIRCLRTELCKTGYGRVKHLVSVGGWNGAHLDESVSATEWYNAFKFFVGDVFDGIDWDLEGHDQMHSPSNYFTAECLHKMGAISRMAKRDGYLISMAPPQSYLDFHGANRFSRFTNLTDPDREWHNEFQYFGSNVYAFMLAEFMDAIDLVSIQFYESYSRAAMMVKKFGMSPSAYLLDYIQQNLSLPVTFSDDPKISLADQVVHLPLSKLVLGFANGWANNQDEKTLYVPTKEIQEAWNELTTRDNQPRGFMFWTIDADGSDDIYFAHELSQVLKNYTYE
jgi:chitinase